MRSIIRKLQSKLPSRSCPNIFQVFYRYILYFTIEISTVFSMSRWLKNAGKLPGEFLSFISWCIFLIKKNSFFDLSIKILFKLPNSSKKNSKFSVRLIFNSWSDERKLFVSLKSFLMKNSKKPKNLRVEF